MKLLFLLVSLLFVILGVASAFIIAAAITYALFWILRYLFKIVDFGCGLVALIFVIFFAIIFIMF